MKLPDPNHTLLLAVGILCVVLVLSAGVFIWQIFSRGSNLSERSGRIPPNMQFALERTAAMSVVRSILANESIVGCRWRITYDRIDEGRIQARLYGKPVCGEGSVDILLNMIFHKLEITKTEMEWSFVVLSGQPASADRVVDSSNAAFRSSLAAAQSITISSAEKLLDKNAVTDSSMEKHNESESVTDAIVENAEAKTCFNCHRPMESGFTFCIYCGSSAT